MGSNFYLDRECISKPVKWFLSQKGQRGSLLVLLAAFCVWTKSLVCKDTVLSGIPLFRVMSEDSALLSRQKFSVPYQLSERSCHPVRTSICLLFHQSERRTLPSGRQSDQASSVRTTCIFRPDLYCFEKLLVQPVSVRTYQQPVRTPLSDRSASDSFQVQNKGRWYTNSDDVVSRPDALIHKARIAIQISLSGHQLALVRTRVQLIWKLPIRLQLSGRLSIMVRTSA
jgi:hypothetical protein